MWRGVVKRLNRANGARSFSSGSRKERFETVVKGLQNLKTSMNKVVVGHSKVKDGIILALVAQQHVYIEGPPGSAKTLLAETVANQTNSRFFFTKMHRDTRVSDLFGDEVLIRENDEETGGEIIRQASKRGGILDCELAVLDDITRAPGEALNVLFRILNERRSNSSGILDSTSSDSYAIPLRTCIATGNPADNEKYYNESLDPASLDRFTIQLQHRGLVDCAMWMEALEVIDMYDNVGIEGESSPGTETAATSKESHSFLEECTYFHKSIAVPNNVKRALLRVLQHLVVDYGLDHNNSILSDRTFLVNALKIMKANAILNGRDRCIMEDLYCLNMLTTFRVPMEVHEQIDDVIKQAILAEEDDNNSDGNDGTPPSSHGATDGDSDKNKEFRKSEDDHAKSLSNDSENEQENYPGGDSSMPQMDSSSDIENDSKGTRAKGDSAMWSRRDGNENVEPYKKPQRNAFDPRLPNNAEDNQDKFKKADINFDGRNESDEKAKQLQAKARADEAGIADARGNNNDITVKGLERLMRGLHGKIQLCKHAQKESSWAGSPRQTKSSKSLSDILDSHPSDRYLWLNDLSPRLPRSYERLTPKRSGSIVMIRDISGSMVGLPSLWSSAVASSVIQMAKRNKMKIGYCEFNEKAYLYKKYDPNGKNLRSNNDGYLKQSYRSNDVFNHDNGIFFTKDYSDVSAWAKQIRSEGTTNYSSPLKLVLDEFEQQLEWYERRGDRSHYNTRHKGNNNLHIVMLTDGVPTEGDLKCNNEKRRAQEMGVSIHTIFVDTVWSFDVRRMSKQAKNNAKKRRGSTYPVVLDELAMLTKGLQYRASLDSNGAIDVVEHKPGTDRWSEVVSEARRRGMDRVGVMAGYGSQSPGYVTHPVVANHK